MHVASRNHSTSSEVSYSALMHLSKQAVSALGSRSHKQLQTLHVSTKCSLHDIHEHHTMTTDTDSKKWTRTRAGNLVNLQIHRSHTIMHKSSPAQSCLERVHIYGKATSHDVKRTFCNCQTTDHDTTCMYIFRPTFKHEIPKD